MWYGGRDEMEKETNDDDDDDDADYDEFSVVALDCFFQKRQSIGPHKGNIFWKGEDKPQWCQRILLKYGPERGRPITKEEEKKADSDLFNNVNVFPEDRYLPLPKNNPTMISQFPIAWVNVTGQESLENNSHSIQNIQEARAIVNLVASLISMEKFKNEDIHIITSYSTQIKLLWNTMLEACKAIKTGTYL
uniref:DNA2/NAM7 helicase-like C-terminal domain-containing protein n=1 Tax=Romanomermis culicivorax TaxID=13658 RepID=A0A915JY59_ROMCU